MLNAMFFYRISRWCYLHHIPVVPKLITLLIFLIYNSKVPYQAKIGCGTKFGYGGIGVVIHSESIIGDNCSIGQQVTVGGNSRYPGVPVIGDNVHIHKGAIVFGGITIGNNVAIGANAVVNRPVPDNAVVAGVPAKVLRIKDVE
ncbi:MAG: serine acetyltransferase [Alistipes sp.]|nr:serine acetyltransferase [Alistipes sp.]MDE7128713.1 serine acetyltransferase [Alistipes sp.]